jgi:hypothetical protein
MKDEKEPKKPLSRKTSYAFFREIPLTPDSEIKNATAIVEVKLPETRLTKCWEGLVRCFRR